MKNLLIIVFCKIDNKKIEEKINVQKTFMWWHCLILQPSNTTYCYLLLQLLDAMQCCEFLQLLDAPIVEGCIWSFQIKKKKKMTMKEMKKLGVMKKK